MKENNIQKAVRQRDEILSIIKKNFLLYEAGEDNSWRVLHNFIILDGQLERDLLDYFK